MQDSRLDRNAPGLVKGITKNRQVVEAARASAERSMMQEHPVLFNYDLNNFVFSIRHSQVQLVLLTFPHPVDRQKKALFEELVRRAYEDVWPQKG